MWSAGRAGRERELERAIVFQSVLLAMAAHDLRQPLQMIMSSYERLARGPHDSAEQRYMNIGRLAVARLSQQLDLLVEALRIHEHSANIQPTPVQLAPLFARLCKDNEDLASRKGVTLRAANQRNCLERTGLAREYPMQSDPERSEIYGLRRARPCLLPSSCRLAEDSGA
jgi:signal transduction histidine kinase